MAVEASSPPIVTETPNGNATNAPPSVTSHRNSDAMTRQMEKLYSVDHSRGNSSSESRLALNDNDSMQISLQRQMAATPTGRHIVQVLEHSTPEDGKKMRRTESEPHELLPAVTPYTFPQTQFV